MGNLKEWFSANELVGIGGLPTSPQGVNKKARVQEWKRQNRDGVQGGAVEYHYSSFPPSVQQALGFDVTENGFTQKASMFENVNGLRITENGVEQREYAFRADWLAKKGLTANRLAMMKMKDDGMHPTICKGDQLLVRSFYHSNKGSIILGLGAEQSTKLIDGIYLIRVNGRLVIRRLQVDLQGNVKVKYDNPLYETIEISKEDFDPTIVAGRLEWFARSIDWNDV